MFTNHEQTYPMNTLREETMVRSKAGIRDACLEVLRQAFGPDTRVT